MPQMSPISWFYMSFLIITSLMSMLIFLSLQKKNSLNKSHKPHHMWLW